MTRNLTDGITAAQLERVREVEDAYRGQEISELEAVQRIMAVAVEAGNAEARVMEDGVVEYRLVGGEWGRAGLT